MDEFFLDHNETIQVRLVDGVPNMMGRVEIGFHGVWGTVCNANWDIHDAHVVCRQLGYDKALVATINSAFGKSVGYVWGSVLDCRGEEARLEDCTIGISSASGYCLDHAEDVGVVCAGAWFDIHVKFFPLVNSMHPICYAVLYILLHMIK